MILRSIKPKIINSLQNFPIVGLLGSRQVGKTTLAKDIQHEYPDSIYLDLELPSDNNKLTNPELYLQQYVDQLVIIDEIQRKPDLFPVLRALVDQNRKPARFLILGSASPDLIRESSESLAGRIIYYELSPFNIQETGNEKENIRKLWLRGGYPESYLSKDLSLSYSWREAFITTYLERDIPQLGIRIPAGQLRRFWTMIAHNHAQIWNASQIANSLAVTAPTIKHYLDILTESFVIRQVRPFYANVKKRLVKSPKVYLRDSGLLHTLLNIQSFNQLYSYPIVGTSWEGFVIEQIWAILPANWQKFYYRTSAGAEIDLICITPDNNMLAFEIKYSLQPKPTRGFWNAFEDLSYSKGFVIYPGEETYPIDNKVSVLSINELTRIIN